MSRITNIKNISDDKVVVTLEMSKEEYDYLRGSLEKIYVFSERDLEFEARLVQRGKKESTKYLLLPKEIRKTVKPTEKVKVAKMESKTKNIFIFSVSKY
jgi:hypothetical protein